MVDGWASCGIAHVYTGCNFDVWSVYVLWYLLSLAICLQRESCSEYFSTSGACTVSMYTVHGHIEDNTAAIKDIADVVTTLVSTAHAALAASPWH